MRYTLLLHYPEQDVDSLGADAIEEGMRAFASYADSLRQAGVLIGAEVLKPSVHTTTLTVAAGRLQIQDGPFADTKEQLGGTVVIDVPDLDAAIRWAGQAPSIHWGTIEIRPGETHTVDGVWVPNQ